VSLKSGPLWDLEKKKKGAKINLEGGGAKLLLEVAIQTGIRRKTILLWPLEMKTTRAKELKSIERNGALWKIQRIHRICIGKGGSCQK